MKKTITYMSTKECFQLFQTKEMKAEYAKELESVDITGFVDCGDYEWVVC